MDIIEVLAKKGIRVELEAEELLRENEELLNDILALNKDFIDLNDIKELLNKKETEKIIQKIEVKRSSKPAIAKEYEANIKIYDKLDITGKSKSKGQVEDFVNYFRSRYSKIAKILLKTRNSVEEMYIEDIKNNVGNKGRFIVFVNAISTTKKGNLMFIVEDPTGVHRAIISSYKQDVLEKAKEVIVDDIIAIEAKIYEEYLIVESIEFPDMKIKERKKSETDLAVAYISDIHFGSKYFLGDVFEQFIRWIKEGKGQAEKLKYIIVGGDVVDGVGVYPKQEKELEVLDIYKQYSMFDDFVEALPDYIEVLVIPGNHDAVRRAEPQEAIPSDFIKSRAHRLGNPSFFELEGIKHLVYHGTSMDSLISHIPKLNYKEPEKVQVEMLKRRHLSTIYGGNPIYPDYVDYLVIEEEPDVFQAGHVHKNGYTDYRGTLVINSGTFQGLTEFQRKQGHIPTPGQVYVYELASAKLNMVDFKG